MLDIAPCHNLNPIPDPCPICAATFEEGVCKGPRVSGSFAERAFVTADQWQALPDTCYGLHGLLNWHESRPRDDAATMSNALAILRELLRRRPAEFGGPMEVR